MTTARSKSLLDNTLEDAKKKLAKIMFAYERMPKVIRATVGLKRDNTEQIQRITPSGGRDGEYQQPASGGCGTQPGRANPRL
jgi:hypothetical protein